MERGKIWDLRKRFGIFNVLLQLKTARFLRISLCLLLYTTDNSKITYFVHQSEQELRITGWYYEK